MSTVDSVCLSVCLSQKNGAESCCRGNEISARRGDLDAYRLVLTIAAAAAATAATSVIYCSSGARFSKNLKSNLR